MLETGTPAWVTQGRIRSAARHAPKAYPGPVGELLARELNAWADLPFLWCDAATGRRMRAVVEDVLGR